MNTKKITQLLLFIFAAVPFSYAHLPPKKNPSEDKTQLAASYRSECAPAMTKTDLNINNVRARLGTGGDLWWNRYVVPLPEPGEVEVNAIYAGGIWLGGWDEGHNLKLACQTYNNNEFWPGPLTDQGQTDPTICSNWDRHFIVHKTSVDQLKANWANALSQNRTELTAEEIPEEIKGWPALGNPFFEGIHGFPLPPMNARYNGLASFWDEGGIVGVFEPQFGDFPILSYDDCQAGIVPDQMVFSITNDGGGIHGSQGDAILMEVQTTSFAFKTSDEVNDMTFYKYRMINRAIENIQSAYMGIWVDPDLGCYLDDYVGCDIERGLGYVYNSDALDGVNNCEDCGQGVPTYCTDIPVLGIDLLRGPMGEQGEEIKMSSFTYYSSPAYNTNPATVDPQNPIGYYHLLNGSWADGTPMTYGGDGYDPSSSNYTKYAFSSAPNDPNGWSMCSENAPSGDFRTVQAAGPFTLIPGAINDLVTGVIFTPSMEYPCPDLSRFFATDDKAQELFDNCFNTMLSAVSEPMNFDPVRIFPNPYFLSSGGSLHLEAVPTAAIVSIYDITGRLLKSYTGEPQMQLDLSQDLNQPSPGTYVIQVRTQEQGTKAYKFVIME